MSPFEHAFQLALALASLAAFVVLLVERVSNTPRRSMDEYLVRRFLLVDALLVIAGIELLTDAIHEIDPGNIVVAGLVFACQGAIMAGAIALAATVKETRERRRATR